MSAMPMPMIISSWFRSRTSRSTAMSDPTIRSIRAKMFSLYREDRSDHRHHHGRTALAIAHDNDGSSAVAHDDLASLVVSGAAAEFTSLRRDRWRWRSIHGALHGAGRHRFEDDGPKVPASPTHCDRRRCAEQWHRRRSGDDAGGTSANFAVNVDFGSDGKAATAIAFTGVVTATYEGCPWPGGRRRSADRRLGAAGARNGYPAGTCRWSGPALNDHSYWTFVVTIEQNGQGTFTLLKPLAIRRPKTATARTAQKRPGKTISSSRSACARRRRRAILSMPW